MIILGVLLGASITLNVVLLFTLVSAVQKLNEKEAQP